MSTKAMPIPSAILVLQMGGLAIINKEDLAEFGLALQSNKMVTPQKVVRGGQTLTFMMLNTFKSFMFGVECLKTNTVNYYTWKQETTETVPALVSSIFPETMKHQSSSTLVPKLFL